MKGDVSSRFDTARDFIGVLLQQGRVELDADSDEYEYTRLRRFQVAILQSLDRALQSNLFEPAYPKELREPRVAPAWTDGNAHDPGIALLELFAWVGDQLSEYADQVAAEAQLRTRRRAAVAAGVGILVLAWWCRRCGCFTGAKPTARRREGPA